MPNENETPKQATVRWMAEVVWEVGKLHAQYISEQDQLKDVCDLAIEALVVLAKDST